MSSPNALRFVRINGKSMMPLLDDGDIGIVLSKSHYNIGDIVIYKYSQGYDEEATISHRIVYKDENLYYCKGDNSLNLEIITRPEIIGMIVSVERKGKRLNLLSDETLLREFCDFSLRCAMKHETGDGEAAKQMAKRCYIKMYKLLKIIQREEL